MARSCTREGLDQILGKISALKLEKTTQRGGDIAIPGSIQKCVDEELGGMV